MQTLAVTFRTMAVADVIVTRAVDYRDLEVDGLLTRPCIAAWSQWIAAAATVPIHRVELRLAFITWARNFWPDPAAFTLESRLADVLFVPRRQRCHLPVELTTRGHFGDRPLQETVVEEIHEIQVWPGCIIMHMSRRSNQLLLPLQKFNYFSF